MVKKFVVWFKDVDKEDVGLVGGKGANLGEMVRADFPVPSGFIITAPAYFHFLTLNKLRQTLGDTLREVDFKDTKSLERGSERIKKAFEKGKIPESCVSQIFQYYRALGGILKDALVAVRSSATAEDLPKASFAGLQETFLNVQGEANLLEKVKETWASLFTPRAMFYRHENKFNHLKIGIAIVVQKMVASEKSGVMFTVDPLTNDKNTIVIEAILGLGELIVQGTVTPDHYKIDKKTLVIQGVNVSPQPIMLVKRGTTNKTIKVGKRTSSKQKLKESEIKKLARLGKEIEKHYYFPQDIEWAIEGGKIYIVQTRPVTTIKVKIPKEKKLIIGPWDLRLLLRGDPASPGIATGPVRVIKRIQELHKVVKGDVIVAPKTNPDFVTTMRKAAGIITDFGGRTSHAAIVSRELGIPAIVGTEKATKLLRDEMLITVNGTTGEIFRGRPFRANGEFDTDRQVPIKTATKLYVNLSDPKKAEEVSLLDVDGVGLLRAEFMLSQMGIHPKKLIHDGRSKKFVNYLADGLRIFCESFNPRPVIYRASDFKTNEYRNLKGGALYEPYEENPMLGLRGAFRYINDPKVFALELEAIKVVRNDLNLSNLWLMLPFVRTVQELLLVKKIVAESGLLRYPSFKLWMMVEVPANVILIDDFIKTGVDGVSIGSNDLTQLLLGVDRDSSELSATFDERSPAVFWAMERVVRAAHRNRVSSSICGEAPSVYPEIIEKLVSLGITSISVEADVISQTREVIREAEGKLLRK